MLTPQERSELARIEAEIAHQDPALAARFHGHRRPRGPRVAAGRVGSLAIDALAMVSLAAGVGVLICVMSAWARGTPVSVSTAVRLSLLCLTSGVLHVVLRVVAATRP